MRRTGSRESRERREASATSPTSIAVKTFSIRFGSRRNQRPDHQKTRSITTVKPMIETIRIGHMMGPPLRKLSMKKLPVTAGPLVVVLGLAEAEADAAGLGERLPLKVALTLAPGMAGVIPGASEAPGATEVPGRGAPGA